MKKCLLCERKTIGNGNFGKSCLKKSYNFLGKYDSKTMRTEQTLNEEILKLCNKKNLPKEQNTLLVDRYLTLNILNKVNIPTYDTYRTAIQNDINSITDTTKKKDLKSFNLITLKQSAEIYKIYQKYEEMYQKIMNGDYDFEQNLIFDAIRFAFSKYYSKKAYLSGVLQFLQFALLLAGSKGLETLNWDLSGKLLAYSLQEKPKDITITESKYINKIIHNNNFKDKINQIIVDCGNEFYFDTGKEKESLAFECNSKDWNSIDLFLAIHNTTIQVIGKKKANEKWDLEIEMSDLYDFTDFQEIKEYVKKEPAALSIIAAIANNFAMIATSCNVVHEYKVTIKFKITNWEVT